MSAIPVEELNLGMSVRVAAKQEWGVGRVTRIQRQAHDGGATYRVYVQFHMGQKVLTAPPAKFVTPDDLSSAAVNRDAGWLDKLAGQTLDDRLAALPESITLFLGSPVHKLIEIAKLFEFDGDDKSLARWARMQTGSPDPLTTWTRDELQAAWEKFSVAREAAFADAVAAAGRQAGRVDWQQVLGNVDPSIRADVAERLRAMRVI
jgi:hypothetical protein